MTQDYVGEFEHLGNIYEILPEDYDDCPEGLDAETRLRYAKQSAINATDETNIDVYSLHAALPSRGEINRFLGDALIIDGNNMAYRCLHTYNLDYHGEDVSVLYGFLSLMMAEMRKLDCKAVMVCWDEGIPAYRQERIPDYKADRKSSLDDDTREDFYRQMSLLHEVLPIFGVVSVRRPNCEADDLIGQAVRLSHGDYRKVIVSSDKDLLQLVGYDTVVAPPKKDLITLDNFQEVVGVPVKDYLIYKCMIGDSSDGLKGIPGIGEKRAQELVDMYGASASNLVNVATGNNTEPPPMSDSIAAKIRKFGLKGFQDNMTVIRLDRDLTGARLTIKTELSYWAEPKIKDIEKFLHSKGFVSLANVDNYRLFSALEMPSNAFIGPVGSELPTPVIPPVRMPVIVSE